MFEILELIEGRAPRVKDDRVADNSFRRRHRKCGLQIWSHCNFDVGITSDNIRNYRAGPAERDQQFNVIVGNRVRDRRHHHAEHDGDISLLKMSKDLVKVFWKLFRDLFDNFLQFLLSAN